jgi:uncharacterized protein YggE
VRRGVVILIVVLILALVGAAAAAIVFATRGEGHSTRDVPIRVTPPTGSFHEVYGTSDATAGPIARLPGITVLGSGKAEIKPDTAIVRLTIGSGSGFDGSDGPVKLIGEHELDPVVDELVHAGADRDEIYVSTLGGSLGPDENAAVVALEWPRPENVNELVAAAQRAVRNDTPYNLQDISVAFRRKDCDRPSETVAREALADARKRAQRIAALSHAKVGRLIAVSEAPSSAGFASLTSSTCGVGDVLAPYLEYQASAGTPHKVTVSTTLEVTFALASD